MRISDWSSDVCSSDLNRVVNSKIGFVVGHVCSGATIAAADIYNNEGVVMVTPSATAPAVTDGKNYEFIFRTIGRDDQQGPAAAQFILEKIKTKKAAVLNQIGRAQGRERVGK